jgi:hypothetical protein
VAEPIAQSIDRAKIYVVGRNERAGACILDELNTLGPGGSCHYIKADLTLRANVDRVCEGEEGE